MLDTKFTQFLDNNNVSCRILPGAEPVCPVKMASLRGVILEEMVKTILLHERHQQPMISLELVTSNLIRLSGATLALIAASME